MKFKIELYLRGVTSVVCVLLLIGCAGTETAQSDYLPVQGDDQYGIQFEPDWKVFEKGTFTYAPWDNLAGRPLKMGGGRAGYRKYYPLVMDFIFKDGRQFHEEFDIEALMRDLMGREAIFDNRRTKWGGSIDLEININTDEIRINYNVYERYENPKGAKYKSPKKHKYHVVTRKL